MRWNKCALLMMGLLASAVVMAGQPHVGFSPAEHVAIGNDVSLQFSKTNPPRKDALLHLPNGLALSYGSILSMGDFYGKVGRPISQAPDEVEMENRFLDVFHSFASEETAKPEVTAVVDAINNENKYIQDGLQQGLTEEALYEKAGLEFDRQFNCATGGGCIVSGWWTKPGRYLELAKENFDHFGDEALSVYKVGHAAAIKIAIAAHHMHDVKQLELAYAMNALASHFLSDRFSTGHIRTPRKVLYDHITPSLVGSLLASYMHNEESRYGFHVHNGFGDKWIAYGDKSYYADKASFHRLKQHEALQSSADEIYYAYLYGVMPNSDAIEKMVPVPDETGNAANQDLSPLFYWNEQTQKIMRRKDVKNPYDNHWTENWWGWSTLTELGINSDIPVISFIELGLH